LHKPRTRVRSRLRRRHSREPGQRRMEPTRRAIGRRPVARRQCD